MSITLYTKANCQPCRLTKRLLDDNEIEYEAVSVDDDPDTIERLIAMGHRQMPVVVVNDEVHWSGFRPDKIKALLDDIDALVGKINALLDE